jgi:hypothetical protein
LFLRSGSPQNVYLLPQRRNFRLERCPRPKQICDHPNNEPDKISHPATASPDSRSTASQIEFAIGTAYNASNPGAKPANYSCNPNYNVAMLDLITRWTPVENPTFSAEVLYVNLDQKFTGTSVLAVAAPLPSAVYEYRDQSTVSLNVRAQRNF